MSQATFAKQLIILQGLINRAISLDEKSSYRLQRLAGKSLRIECTEPYFDCLIYIEAQHIVLSTISENRDTLKEPVVTTHIQGSLSSFFEIASASDKAAALINADIRLIGDSQLLIDLQQALNFIDLDWEYQLAKLVGDIPAHLLGDFGRTTVSHLVRLKPIFFRHLQEFIQQETRTAPLQTELDDWQKELVQTRQQIDRITAKVDMATQAIEQYKNKQ